MCRVPALSLLMVFSSERDVGGRPWGRGCYALPFDVGGIRAGRIGPDGSRVATSTPRRCTTGTGELSKMRAVVRGHQATTGEADDFTCRDAAPGLDALTT